MGSRKSPGPVPDRWLNCPRKSISLLQGKFLIFKTPLSQAFNDQVPLENRFPPSFVFSSMKSYKVKIGLWIDLTNTSRFYDKSEIESNDCRYVKIQCKGRGETPSVEQTNTFIKVCDMFIKQNPLSAVGIHCTHGFNRSGFMVISYLVSELDWDLDAALREFANARPPGIYKSDYILELYKRYSEVECAPEAPPLPDWCLEFEDDGNESDGEDASSHSSKRKIEDDVSDQTKRKKRREFERQNPTFMDGVNGVEPVGHPLLADIRRKVQTMCGWERAGFPGCQPISMTLENMVLLNKKPYRVSWKADGVRYLMYIKGPKEVYCIDRDNSVFHIRNLTFPFKKDLKQHLKDTLLDGEMVMDIVDGVNVPRYLVYDVITVIGYQIRNDPFFPNRYQAIAKEITEPRYEAIRQGLINKNAEPFSVRPKEFCDVRDAGKFLSDKFCQALTHEPDGLIFQPSSEPYIPGRCDEVLKWKPASLNSVDFKLKIKKEEGMGLLPTKYGELYVGHDNVLFSKLKPVKDLLHLDNKIIECTYNNGRWVFLRERTDKSYPNSFDTAKAVCESIARPVTKEILLDYIHRNRYCDGMLPPSRLPPRFHSEFS